MWGKKTQEAKVSTFYQGLNIIETLGKSVFGKIKDTMLTIFGLEHAKKYRLPKIIVVGNESTGKSSLLENITKCQLFPRDSKLCTKCPVHVKIKNGKSNYSISYYEPLTNTKASIDKSKSKLIKVQIENKNDIYPKVLEYMNKIPVDTISEDELIIEICGEELPTFDFFDLPGIRAYPPELAETTTELCRKYLSDKNSIILCVVPATTTRLTSCQSIALITEMGMQDKCILALTMADRLQMENIEELLIKRIIRTSDEIKGLNFAGYVSIVNRLHSDCHSLEENDLNEKKWFDENIVNCIPENYKQFENTIKENIMVSNLLKQIDALYSKYINENWKPKVIKEIENKISELEFEYYDLGEIVTQGLVDSMNKQLTEFIKNIYYGGHYMNFYPEIIYEEKSMMDEDKKYHYILSQINKIYIGYEKNEHTKVFDYIVSEVGNMAEFKMFRFPKVIIKLAYYIKDSMKNKSLEKLPEVKKMTIDVLNKNYIDENMDECRTIFSKFYRLYVIYTTFNTKINFQIEDYEESEEYRDKRVKLLNEIALSKEHLNKISELKV
jgi:GTP-binding protein EngB required for normal cell division